MGDDLALSKITSDKVIEIHSEIAKKAWAAATKKKYWDTFRAFITDAAQNGWMNLPANLRSKRLVFEVKLKQKTLPDLDDMRVFLNSLDDRLKLYAMLALNCGMNNIDIVQRSRITWCHLLVEHHNEDQQTGNNYCQRTVA